MPNDRFLFAVCHPSCRALLKGEVAFRYPGLRLAFGAPGLVTFKQVDALPHFAPRLALVAGESLGKLVSAEALAQHLDERKVGPVVARAWRGFDVDAEPTGSAIVPSSIEDALALRGAPRDASAQTFLDVVHLPGGGAPWLGLSVEDSNARRLTVPIAVRDDAPSRAYAKLEEVLAATDLPLAAGQYVLELGAAPGGATSALLERGLEVVAVDPGDLDVRVTEGRHAARLHVVKKPAGQLVLGDLSRVRVDWLVSDMNLAPPVAATQIAHAWALVKKTARGAILTIKMNDERAVRALPDVERRLSGLMGGTLRVLHLPSHRREVALVIERRR